MLADAAVQLQTILVASIIAGKADVNTKKRHVSTGNIMLRSQNFGILSKSGKNLYTLH